MPTIRPMADLRDTGKISELCYQKNEPVFITKNGSGHLVVMSMDTYEKQLGILAPRKNNWRMAFRFWMETR